MLFTNPPCHPLPMYPLFIRVAMMTLLAKNVILVWMKEMWNQWETERQRHPSELFIDLIISGETSFHGQFWGLRRDAQRQGIWALFKFFRAEKNGCLCHAYSLSAHRHVPERQHFIFSVFWRQNGSVSVQTNTPSSKTHNTKVSGSQPCGEKQIIPHL